MNFIPTNLISIAPNRQRRLFDLASINELKESIEGKTGLLHALVLRADGPNFYLVAGERRLRAINDIYELGGSFTYSGAVVPKGQVPYTLLTDLSDLEAWEAELEENIRRVDLTWAERAQATAQLMELRKLQAEEADQPPPTVAEIALEVRDSAIGSAQDNTRKELIVSRFLDDPEVAKAGSLQEAFKVLKKKEAGKQSAALAERVGRAFTSAAHTLLNQDAIEWLRNPPKGQFHVILTDPPYGMGADGFGDSGKGVVAAAHGYSDSPEVFQSILQVLPRGIYAAAADNAHAYVFCDIDNFSELRKRMSEAGWKVHRTPIIWHNPDGFRAPWPDAGPQRKYELVLYAIKGERKVNYLGPDVIACRKDATQGHQAQKPVPLLVELLKRSAQAGDQVLDPFMGSGSTLAACHELKLTGTGIEIDPAAYGIAVKRIGELA